jgi:catechol 2,3-dioxygenase-like lactoylglutathione lyase family enzyme
MPDSAITKMHMTVVTVSDQDAAVRFWTERLGFELRSDLPYGDGSRWVEVAPPGGETVLALVPPMRPDSPGPGRPTGVGFTTADIDAAYASLRDQGVDVDDEIMRMGDPVPPLFSFRDNDANEFMVAQTG